MTLGVPPALLLAILLAAIATQLGYMIRPGQPKYRLRFAGAAVAMLAAEVLARFGLGRNLFIGDLHPLVDLACLALSQWLVIRFGAPNRPRSAASKEESGPPRFKAELRRGM